MREQGSPKKSSLLALAVILTSISVTAGSPQQVSPPGRSNVPSGPKITVLNPAVANAMVPRLPLSPRLSSLEGKTIYMVDIGWGGPEAGYDVLQVISRRLTQEIRDVKTVVLRKKGSYMADDPELWKEIKTKGNAAILGLSC